MSDQTTHFPVVAHVSFASLKAPRYVALASKNPSDGGTVASALSDVCGPKTGAVGSLWDVVRDPRLNHRPEVYAGVLEPECAELMRDFFR